jgi:hypothetical protein
MRAQCDTLGDRSDERRVRVPDQRDSVAAVQVDVLRAVDVVDLGTLAVAEPYGLRLGDLPVRGGAAGERAASPFHHRRRLRLATQELCFLLGDARVEVAQLEGGGGRVRVCRFGNGPEAHDYLILRPSAPV